MRSRVIAVEMGLLRADPNWSTPQAFESLVLLMKRYGVAGGCFWRWTFFYDDENLDPTQAMPVKKRGLNFIYNPVKDMIAKYFFRPVISDRKVVGPGGEPSLRQTSRGSEAAVRKE